MPLRFPGKEDVLYAHAQLLSRFGGLAGLRDEGALESALTAVTHRAFYEDASLAICAATYAYHLTQAHAFMDGNKRIAALMAEAFIEWNESKLAATDEEMITLFLAIAAGEIARNAVEQWFETRVG